MDTYLDDIANITDDDLVISKEPMLTILLHGKTIAQILGDLCSRYNVLITNYSSDIYETEGQGILEYYRKLMEVSPSIKMGDLFFNAKTPEEIKNEFNTTTRTFKLNNLTDNPKDILRDKLLEHFKLSQCKKNLFIFDDNVDVSNRASANGCTSFNINEAKYKSFLEGIQAAKLFIETAEKSP